ncbi:MAG: TetR/AcrR family transcriptional regulator [candidate division FCPU426 bacterium]
MKRTEPSTDLKLIEAAIALLPAVGFSRLSLRAVAKKAGVNLGMFHYYFKTKREFMRRVAEVFYEDFFREFTLKAASGKDPKEKLYNALFNLACFARNHRQLLLALGRDILEGDQQIVKLLEEHVPRHAVIILDLIRQCQRQRLIAQAPLPIIITYIISSVAGPSIMMGALEKANLKPPLNIIKNVGIPIMMKDHILRMRLDLAFRALDPDVSLESMPSALNRRINQIIDFYLDRNRRKTPEEPLQTTGSSRLKTRRMS